MNTHDKLYAIYYNVSKCIVSFLYCGGNDDWKFLRADLAASRQSTLGKDIRLDIFEDIEMLSSNTMRNIMLPSVEFIKNYEYSCKYN